MSGRARREAWKYGEQGFGCTKHWTANWDARSSENSPPSPATRRVNSLEFTSEMKVILGKFEDRDGQTDFKACCCRKGCGMHIQCVEFVGRQGGSGEMQLQRHIAVKIGMYCHMT